MRHSHGTRSPLTVRSILSTEFRSRYGPRALHSLVLEAGTSAGVAGRHHLHRWRPAYATSLVLRGEDIHVVQRLMGHFQHRDHEVPAFVLATILKDVFAGQRLAQLFICVQEATTLVGCVSEFRVSLTPPDLAHAPQQEEMTNLAVAIWICADCGFIRAHSAAPELFGRR